MPMSSLSDGGLTTLRAVKHDLGKTDHPIRCSSVFEGSSKGAFDMAATRKMSAFWHSRSCLVSKTAALYESRSC